MPLIKPSQANVPFHLNEYSYDEKEVLNGLKKLKFNSAESTKSLRRLLKEKSRIKEEIKEKMHEHGSTILKNDLPPKEKDPESFILPCKINDICFDKALADLGASVSVMPYSTFTNPGLGELAHTKLIIELANKTVKRPKGLRENMELDLKARLMGEALILIRSQDYKFRDFLKLNDLNEPLELRNHEIDDLSPTVKEGEVIDEPMVDIVKIRYDDDKIKKIDEYPSFCDYDGKIHINCAYNLQFSYMIGTNVAGTFMNEPIFVANFFIFTDFTVMENMDAYRDKDMGDVIFGKPFCMDAGVKARRID
nr:hypothetical protein [Tanacetum cinerariifolium]